MAWDARKGSGSFRVHVHRGTRHCIALDRTALSFGARGSCQGRIVSVKRRRLTRKLTTSLSHLSPFAVATAELLCCGISRRAINCFPSARSGHRRSRFLLLLRIMRSLPCTC